MKYNLWRFQCITFIQNDSVSAVLPKDSPELEEGDDFDVYCFEKLLFQGVVVSSYKTELGDLIVAAVETSKPSGAGDPMHSVMGRLRQSVEDLGDHYKKTFVEELVRDMRKEPFIALVGGADRRTTFMCIRCRGEEETPEFISGAGPYCQDCARKLKVRSSEGESTCSTG